MNINKVQNKINSKYPKESLTVLNYSGASKPMSIRCKCGGITTLEQAQSFFNKSKKSVCKNCNKNKSYYSEKTYRKMIAFLEGSIDYELLGDYPNINSGTKFLIKCKHCGESAEKTAHHILTGKRCQCLSKNKKKTNYDIDKELPADIKLIEDYKGANEKVLFRHNCGFTWKTTPHLILSKGTGCPKCNRKISKGEKAISNYLEKNDIDFKRECPVIINGKTLRADFFIPHISLFIEYHGEQHYSPVPHFGGISKFKKQQMHDELKRKHLKNYLEISYLNFNHIEEILNSTFNDYLERE